jgi:exonuclease VII large subunit
VPAEHRTDSLSACFRNRDGSYAGDYTSRYRELCAHLGVTATRNNRGVAHENGAIEGPHRHWKRRLEQQHQKLDRAGLRLDLLDPKLVLQRGYAWLQDEQGSTVSQAAQARLGQALQATLADGSLGLTVQALGPSAPVLK